MTGGPHPAKRIDGVEPAASPKRKEILCDGWYYDVTEFAKRHPGGAIINYYTNTGEDATHAIQQFHHRTSAKINAMLKSFKRRRAEDIEVFTDDPEKAKRHKALTEDFNKLYIELEKEGMFKPSYSRTLYRLIEPFAFFFVGFYLLGFQSMAIKFLACALIGMSTGRAGWLQHECGHLSLTGHPKVDRFLNDIYQGAFYGMSAGYWRNNHNRHHAMPQRLKYDWDLKTLPLLAFNSQVVENPKQGKSFFLQHQKFLFLLVDSLIVTAFYQLYLHPSYIYKRRYYRQGFCVLLHHVFAYQIGLWPTILATWLAAGYMLWNFSLSHTHLPVTNEPTHWVEYAFTHTADVEQKPWCDWWMGYLNYQIEHHLFPSLPQFRSPKIVSRVKSLAEKHGLPYHVLSYKEACYTTFKNLDNVSRELKEL